MIKKDAFERKTGNLTGMPIEVLTPEDMNRADRLAIERGNAGYDLMKAAGEAVAGCAMEMCTGRILVLAGPGNNGGDGLVAARCLAEAGRPVSVVLLGSPERLKGDAAAAFADCPIAVTSFEADGAADVDIGSADLIIDSLFGAGLSRGLSGGLAALIERINQGMAQILAVDLPSGVNGANGAIAGNAIKADRTVTFFRLKPGHLLYPGRTHCGQTGLVQIGIPEDILKDIDPDIFINGPELWQCRLPAIGAETHKYQRGHALVVSGPWMKTGAARLSARAALRVGAGLVTVAANREAARIQAMHLTAIMIDECSNARQLAGILADGRISAVAIGPAAGLGRLTQSNVAACLKSSAAAVLDADALSVFAADPAELFTAIASRKAPVVLTPHEGEFARLFNGLEGDRLMRAGQAAEISGAIVVLKGADTIVADPSGLVSIAVNAPPWLATAGSGDVLTGMVAGFLAQGMPPFYAASAAVWLHAEAANDFGFGLIADDLPDAIPQVLQKIKLF